MLEVNNLSYSYPDGHGALRDIGFSVDAGERVALVGPNGAGKSTLLLHLNGLLPDVGQAESSVTVDGIPVTSENLMKVRARVGLLFQEPDDQLFCPTIGEDVGFGPRQLGVRGNALTELVAESLARVGLSGFEERRPHLLSQGEKRRACIAGLLACDSILLALDEPTSNLDPRGRRELKEILKSLPVALIIATHDLELVVEICSRVIVMDQGSIVAQGQPEEVLNNEELMLMHGLERPHILRHRHPH